MEQQWAATLLKALSNPNVGTVRSLLAILYNKGTVHADLCLNDVPLLYWAAIYGNVPAIEFLVGHGADIHCREPTNNSTPLHGACWHNKPEAVRLLLQLGAQTDVKNKCGDTPMDDAQAKGSGVIIHLLQNPPTLSRVDPYQMKIFHKLDIPTVVINPGGKRTLRVVCLSDTHDRFKGTVPNGDILIHSGDITSNGLKIEYERFNQWFSTLPHKHKILIPGNHDYGIDALNEDELKAFFPHCTVLVNSGVTVEGINIYGIPWSGHEMSYHVTHETEAMRDKFYIPDDVHILATHIPPLLLSDLAWVSVDSDESQRQANSPCHQCKKNHPSFYHWGSRQLLDKVLEKKPKVHQFGHVHDSPMTIEYNGTLFLNAAVDLLRVVRCFDAVV